MKQFERRLDVPVRLAVILSMVCVLVLVSAGAAAAAPGGPTKPLAKNIIFMIADGSGYNHYLAADYYQFGATGLQPYEDFPFQFAMSTYSASNLVNDAGAPGYEPAKAWSDWFYPKTYPTKTTDSAAAATVMATGVKTNNGYIGMDPAKVPLVNVTQKAKAKGRSAGVITTVPLSHATPAGFVAHNTNRNDYVNIAKEMINDSGIDVIMGAGDPLPTTCMDSTISGDPYKYVGGQSTWEALLAGTAGGTTPWTLIRDQKQFQDLASGPTPKRLIGVPRVNETLQQDRCGNPTADAFTVPFRENIPTLAEMTKAALNVLDNNSKGFFLMVEGGGVDYASHDAQPGRVVEERVDFNKAIYAVLDWVKKNSNWGETLLVIAADHETGYLWGPGSGPTANPMWKPIVNNGAGVQPGLQFNDKEHSNSLVPVWAKGDAARFLPDCADHVDPVRGPYIDNTELGKIVIRALESPKDRTQVCTEF